MIKMVYFLLLISMTVLPTELLCLNQAETGSSSDWIDIDDLMNTRIETAGKKSESLKDVPASVLVLTKEEISTLGFKTFQDILAYIPGMFVVDDYYWLGSISYGMRGFFSQGPSNNMIVLVNGVNQMSDKYSDYPDVLMNLNAESIDRIEIVRGPMSVVYGPGAFFGAINIITNQVDTKEPLASVSVSYGDYGTQLINSYLSGKEGDISFKIVGSIYHTDGIDNSFSDMTTKIGVLEYVGLDSSSTIEGQRTDDRKLISMSLIYKNFFGEMRFSQTKKSVFDGQPNLPRGTLFNSNAMTGVVGYQDEIINGIYSQMKFGIYVNNHNIDYEVFHKYYYEIDAQNTNSMDFEISNNATITENLNLLFGYFRRTVMDIYQISDFHYYGLDYGAREIGMPEGETFSIDALYAQIDYQPLENLKLVLGARVNHLDDYNIFYSRGIISENPDDNRPPDSTFRIVQTARFSPKNNGFTFVGRAALIFDINDNNVVKLLWGQATKQPSFTENYRQMPDNRPFLEPAFINTFELNYFASFSNIFNCDFSIFFNKLDNLISTKNFYNETTDEWEIYSIASGKMETIGAELIIHAQLLDNMKVFAGATYQNTQDLRPGYENIEVAYSPKLQIKGSVTYNLIDDLSFALLGFYRSEVETFWKTETTPEEGERIGNSLDPQFSIDLNIRYENAFIDNLFASCKIVNILDEQIRYPTTMSNAWANKGTLGFGRSFIFTLGYKF